MKKFSKIFAITLLSFLFVVNFASAAGLDINIWEGTGSNGQTCNASPGGCSLCDGMKVAGNLVNIATEVAISITVVMIVYGAIRLMLSGASENNLGEAKKIIKGSIIGFVIVLCGWLLVNTVISFIAGQPNFPWNSIQC